MRHRMRSRKLGRSSAHRLALYRNMVTDFLDKDFTGFLGNQTGLPKRNGGILDILGNVIVNESDFFHVRGILFTCHQLLDHFFYFIAFPGLCL